MKQESVPHLIVTASDLEAWAQRLQTAQWLAIDTESDSFHRYREKVCLIQMTAHGEDVIIDPLAVPSLSCLAPILANPNITKIFHDAGYDLICLRRDFGFVVRGLFDTMLASRILGERHFGLAAILRARYGFEADKRQQRSDWAHRPLSAAQLHYARYDTHFLPELALSLTQELQQAGRLAWAQEDFARLPEAAERAAARPSRADPEAFWRVQGVKKFDAAAKGRLRALYDLRERIALRLDRPAFKVFNEEVLTAMVQAPPANLEAFKTPSGGRRHGAGRFAQEVLDALAHATPIEGDPPKNSGRKRRNGRMLDPLARERYEALRVQRRLCADALGLEPEVVLSNAIIEELARVPPKSEVEFTQHAEFCGWRKTPLLAPMQAVLQSLEAQAHQGTVAPEGDGDGQIDRGRNDGGDVLAPAPENQASAPHLAPTQQTDP